MVGWTEGTEKHHLSAEHNMSPATIAVIQNQLTQYKRTGDELSRPIVVNTVKSGQPNPNQQLNAS